MKEEVRVRLCRNVIIFRRVVYHLYEYIYNLSNNIYIQSIKYLIYIYILCLIVIFDLVFFRIIIFFLFNFD